MSELKRKFKEERKKILEKYGLPMSEIPDKYLKDENGLVEGFSRLQIKLFKEI